MQIKEYILKAFVSEGVDTLFMVPGGLIDPFLSAFEKVPQMRPIVASQEGGAAYMADGYSRASGKFGACLAIGGPGVGNMTTPLMAALSDESPLFVISGEVPTQKEGLGEFQDASIAALDDFDVIKPVTLCSMYTEQGALFPFYFRKLMGTMRGLREGPVHLDLPKDVQETPIEYSYEPLLREALSHEVLEARGTQEALSRLKASKGKIAIYAGTGALRAACHEELIQCAERYGIPVATTQKAKGLFPEDHPLSLGCFGYAGTRHAAQAFLGSEIDLILVLGSGLSERDTMAWSRSFVPKEGFVHVDLDFERMIQFPKSDLIVQGNCKTFLQSLLSSAEALTSLTKTLSVRTQWIEEIRSEGRYYQEETRGSDAIPIHPARVVVDLRAVMPRDTVVLVDSGAHRAFTVHHWQSFAPRQFLSAANLGPMGWAIPAAVGAYFAAPEAPHVVITGDGCMLMHGMEIQTAARYGLPIIFVVINNAALGNVYLRAEKEGRGPQELTSLPNHDWAQFAESLGVKGMTVSDPSDLQGAFKQALDAKTTVLIDVKCSKEFPTPVIPYTQAASGLPYED